MFFRVHFVGKVPMLWMWNRLPGDSDIQIFQSVCIFPEPSLDVSAGSFMRSNVNDQSSFHVDCCQASGNEHFTWGPGLISLFVAKRWCLTPGLWLTFNFDDPFIWVFDLLWCSADGLVFRWVVVDVRLPAVGLRSFPGIEFIVIANLDKFSSSVVVECPAIGLERFFEIKLFL